MAQRSEIEVTFQPEDPPRLGRFLLYDRAHPDEAPRLTAGTGGGTAVVEMALPAGRTVRRRPVAATALTIEQALGVLVTDAVHGVGGEPETAASAAEADLDLDDPDDLDGPDDPPSPDGPNHADGLDGPAARAFAHSSQSLSARAWSAALVAGLGIVARGRLRPSVTPKDHDAWVVGPLDPADVKLVNRLASAFPASAYPLPLRSGSPLLLRSPGALLRACWDGLADTLPRTATAVQVADDLRYAAVEPQKVADLRPWLAEAGGDLEGGATVALRVELDADPTALADPTDIDPTDIDPTDPDPTDPAYDPDPTDPAPPDPAADHAARAVLQLTSRADPSLVLDAADLWHASGVVRSRFGVDAEADLLVALRRGARAWPPLAALLAERAPEAVPLTDGQVETLLTTPDLLEGTGIEVLWPTDLVTDGLTLRATVAPPPGKVTDAGFSLTSLLELRWQAMLAGQALTPAEVELLAQAKRGLVRLRGRWVVIRPDLLERLRARARRLSAGEALGAVLAGRVDMDGEPVPVVAEGPLEALRAELAAPAGDADVKPPPGLAAELRPYQQRGLAWLARMTRTGIGGCLADDMGLGKTVQVIGLHLHQTDGRTGPSGAAQPSGRQKSQKSQKAQKAQKQRRTKAPAISAPATPTLVVCPTSLLGNWEREVQRFAPGVDVRRFHGPQRDLDGIDPAGIVLTTYGVLRRDHARLAETTWGLMVADEAQAAKNPHSATARSLRAVPAAARIALTGTPVENRLSELWAILDWTTPGLLGPLERFVHKVAVPVERYQDDQATERLAGMIRPFLLRRRKTDPEIASDLPPRTVTDQPVPLSTEQATLYTAEVREALDAIRSETGIARQGLVLRMLTVLKQICNHPAQYLHQKGPLPGRSGKLAALEELVDVIVAEGESVLVFSQFVECARLIERRLTQLGIDSLFLHGGVPARRRQEMVDRFQAGEVPVFLLSLKAGGVGLNLTKATHVVHFDRWWNPAVEDQATDRAHRIGQDRPVQVHRLITEGTLEDRIAALLERKRSLAEAVVGGGEGWIGDLSNEELAQLVELGESP